MFDVRRDGDPVLAAQQMLGAAGEANAVTRALQVALSAWGYDFHNPVNQARSNDLLVRERVSCWIRDGAAALDELERSYARERVAPATKEHPFPSPEVAAAIRMLRRLRDTLQALAARIDALETPMGDQVWKRFSRERALLDVLVTADVALLAYAQNLRTVILELDVAAVDTSEPFAHIKTLLENIDSQLRRRADMLLL